jgi:hypothetical protein
MKPCKVTLATTGWGLAGGGWGGINKAQAPQNGLALGDTEWTWTRTLRQRYPLCSRLREAPASSFHSGGLQIREGQRRSLLSAPIMQRRFVSWILEKCIHADALLAVRASPGYWGLLQHAS